MSGFSLDREDEFARGARSLLILPQIDGDGGFDVKARLEEGRGLALAIGLNVVEARAYRVRAPRAATLLGGGQIEEIGAIIQEQSAELLIVDAQLSAIQQRNLEDRTGVKVIDRTGLILEIFGERAATAEGRSASRAGAPRLSGGTTGPQLDPFGTAARWFRISGRSGAKRRLRPTAD